MAEYLARFLLLSIVGVAVLMPTVSVADSTNPAESVDRSSADYPDTPKPLTDLLREDPLSRSEEDDKHEISANAQSPIEVVEERYANGRIKIRREVTQDEQGNHIHHGSWELWDGKGTSVASGTYSNDRRHGMWSRVYLADEARLFSQLPYKGFRGPFTSHASFKDGKLHGKWIILDSENRIISEWDYANGLRHGRCVWNYPSGHLMKEMVFHDGLIDGYVRMYDVNSKLIDDETYQQGRKVALKVKYDDAGKIKWEGVYLQSQIVIDSPDDWWNAKPVKYTDDEKIVKPEALASWLAHRQTQNARADTIANSVVTRVKAVADLKLDVIDPRGARPVGEHSEYEIQVVNRGTDSARRIQILAICSPDVEPVDVTGSAAIESGQIFFRPITELRSEQKIVHKVTVRAHKEGSHSFRVIVQCDDPETRLASEETTRFFVRPITLQIVTKPPTVGRKDRIR